MTLFEIQEIAVPGFDEEAIADAAMRYTTPIFLYATLKQDLEKLEQTPELTEAYYTRVTGIKTVMQNLKNTYGF